ncbi:MAG: MFS transporter [Alphaproteobacteria bacterium]|nr:MFS transporter [Alphaproteobacteria bacterium]
MMSLTSARLAQGFSLVGHAFMHMLVALFLTVVLALEREWNLPYAELIGLWTVGAFLVGAFAPLAGFLGDRWSAPGMMAVFFLGSGAATVACGFADGPAALGLGLALLGVFAAIYHPVGMAWLVRTAVNRGMALGVFGVFGSAGVALAGLVAAGLVDFFGWRAAFIVPGAVAVAIGAALVACIASGWVSDGKLDRAPQADPSRADMMRAFFVLSVTVFLGGLVYQGTQVAMPKALSLQAAALVGSGTLGAGALFTAIYLVAGVLQIAGGWLVDRYPLKWVYLWTYTFQVPLLFVAASATGIPFVLAVLLAVVLNVGSLPAENCLMARYTPSRWRSSAFGAKFVLSLGVAPVAVQLVAWIQGTTGGFFLLFAVLAAAAAMVVVAIVALPAEAEAPAPQVASAAE